MVAYEYLITLALVLLITLYLETLYHVHLYQNRKERFRVIIFLFVVGTIWDSFAIWRGHWVFPRDHNLNIFIGVMPIEEYLFMFVVPYFIITIYKIMHGKRRPR